MNKLSESQKNIPHSYIEDLFAILLSTIIISFGLVLLKQVGSLTGSSVGIAFLISYTTSLSFSYVFFLINLPFYLLAIYRMGWEFTIKTCLSVGLVSFFINIHKLFIHFFVLNPLYATLLGNIMIGIGFIILFRHKASLGGINILSLCLQDYIGISAGNFQMIVDIIVILISLFVVSLPTLIISIIGAVILNLIIAVNHKPGRYLS